MLGRQLHDPLGLEGAPGSQAGLGLLDCETSLEPEKQLRNVGGHLQLPGEPAFTGYEIHMGTTHGAALHKPAATFADGRNDGAQSADGQIIASYCHGLFDHPEALAALLAWAGMASPLAVDFAQRREADIERLANATEAALDWKVLDGLIGTAA
jgi:adenosylcobyric acid synthase